MIVPGGDLGQACVAYLGHAAARPSRRDHLRARDVQPERRPPSPPRGRSGRVSCRCSSPSPGRPRDERRVGGAAAASSSVDIAWIFVSARRARSAGAAGARSRRRTPPRAAPRAPAATAAGCGRAGRPCPAGQPLLTPGSSANSGALARRPSPPAAALVDRLEAPRRITMYMRSGSMAIVVRRASLRQRQLRPDPARGAGGHRCCQPRPRRRPTAPTSGPRACRRVLGAHFGPDATVFPVFNGTGANVVSLRSMLRPWQGVICAESAHLNVDEGGAPETLGRDQAADRARRRRQADAELVDALDRADRRRARRPARRRLGHAVDRARDALLRRGAAGAGRARSRARDAVAHRRLAAGERGRVAGLRAARDHDRHRRRRRLARAGRRSACWRPRRSSCSTRSWPLAARTCASSRCSSPRRCASCPRSCWRCWRATCGAARPATPTRWRARLADGDRRELPITQEVQANGLVFAILPPGAAQTAAAGFQVLCLGRAHRPGALDGARNTTEEDVDPLRRSHPRGVVQGSALAPCKECAKAAARRLAGVVPRGTHGKVALRKNSLSQQPGGRHDPAKASSGLRHCGRPGRAGRSRPPPRPGCAALWSARMNMPSAMAGGPISPRRRDRAGRGLPAWQHHPFRQCRPDPDRGGAPEMALQQEIDWIAKPPGLDEVRTPLLTRFHIWDRALAYRGYKTRHRDLCESLGGRRSRPAASHQPHRRRLQPGRQDQGQRFCQPRRREGHRQQSLPRLGLRCALARQRQCHPGPARQRQDAGRPLHHGDPGLGQPGPDE